MGTYKFTTTSFFLTVVEDIRLLDFDLHPRREDCVDFILGTTTVPPSVFPGQPLDDQAVGGVVRKGRVWLLEPEEVWLGDSSGSALQHQLLTFDPWGGLRLLGYLHTLWNRIVLRSSAAT